MWIYLIFLFPLWFGWEITKRYEVAVRTGNQVQTALLAFVLGMVVVIVTPAAWIWFYPPPAVERMSQVALLGQYASAALFAGVGLRLWVTFSLWRRIFYYLDKADEWLYSRFP